MMLGTDFPFSDSLPQRDVNIIQVDRDPGHLGRRAPLALGVVADIKAMLSALASMVEEKTDEKFLRTHVESTERSARRLGHCARSPCDL